MSCYVFVAKTVEERIDNIIVLLYNNIGGEKMGANYVTTNIRLPKEMLKALKHRAVEEEKSIAQLIREAIEQVFIKRQRMSSKRGFKKDSFFKIVGMFDDGIKDGSIHHDRDIYGVD